MFAGAYSASAGTCIQDCDDKIEKNHPIGICAKENSKKFKLTKDVGFGNTYEKSLWYDFKPYGVCIVDKNDGHPTRLGQQSLRFELRDGDCGYGSSWSDCGSDRGRHELSGKKHKNGSEHWYFWSIYLPDDYQSIYPAVTLLGQFHQDDGEPVLTLDNDGGGYNYEQWLGDKFINSFPLLEPIEMLGRWNDVVINAKWTDKDDGFLSIWINGKLAHDYNGPTKEKGFKAYHKFGIYHSKLSRYTSGKIPTQVVYYDEVRTANSCKKLKLDELGYDCQSLLGEGKKRKQEDDKIEKNHSIGICVKENSRKFQLTKDVGFGNRYKISLWEDYKPYGACIVDKNDGYPTRLGQQSLRFELRDGDCGYNKRGWSDCDNDRQRHELASQPFKSNVNYWFAWSIYLSDDYQVIYPVKNALGQFHQNDGFPLFMFQNHNGGYHLDRQFNYRTINHMKLLEQEDMLGRWNDIIVNAKWTHKDDGFFKLWVNGKLMHVFEGQTQSEGDTVYQKLGIYHGYLSRAKVSRIPSHVVYYDEVRTARSCSKLKLGDLGYDCDELIEQ